MVRKENNIKEHSKQDSVHNTMIRKMDKNVMSLTSKHKIINIFLPAAILCTALSWLP